MNIPPLAVKLGAGAAAAAVGVGVVAAAAKRSPEDPDRRELVSRVLGGFGGAATVGAVLARRTTAFAPLLGLGLGLATAGTVDAIRASTLGVGPGGGAPPAEPPVEAPEPARLDALRPGDLLPDGVQAAPTEVFRRGNEVRFDSVVGNAGAAPLQLALHFDQGSSRTTQVIFNADGTATERDLQGGLRLDERRDHSHLHFDDFVYFQLYRADEDGRPDLARGEVSGGVKQSFYITDIQQFEVDDRANRRAARSLAQGGQVDRSIVPADVVQGISAGMADVYGAELQGQSLDLGDAEPGRYVLRQSFDPSDEVLEQDERNNVADTLIEVRPDGQVRTIRTDFVPERNFVTLPDGRVVVPAVKDSLDHAREHGAAADHQH